MKKTVLVAVIALIITLIPSVVLANEQNIAIVGTIKDKPVGVTPVAEVNNLATSSETDKVLELLENGTNVIIANQTITPEMYSDLTKAALKIDPKKTVVLARISGTNQEETQHLLNSYLASAHFFDGPVTRIYPTLNLHFLGESVVGASWDMPTHDGSVIKPEVNMDDPSKLQENIEKAASILANGGDLLVAGGPSGPVSESTYQKIIDRAAQIDPNHIGSIVRIGGENKEQTARYMGCYVNSEFWLISRN